MNRLECAVRLLRGRRLLHHVPHLWLLLRLHILLDSLLLLTGGIGLLPRRLLQHILHGLCRRLRNVCLLLRHDLLDDILRLLLGAGELLP